MEKLDSLPKIDLIYTSVANYAIQQNRVPIVRKLVIENPSEKDILDLNIEIKGEPDFINHWSSRIEIIPSKQKIEIKVTGLYLSAQFLSELTERLNGELILTLYSGSEILALNHYNVDVLAYDQWNGIRVLPEMLAAFVTPNHPEIARILKTASNILEDWTGNPSFDAYQSLSPDRVKKQIGAIFEAIVGFGLVYCVPPASFENEGQRIRMCDTIFSQRLGTCVDMAILFASCIEAIGLNPLLIITKGHAFAGAWLIDDMFADSVNDDVSLLKKRVALGINEITLVEATFMNAGNSQPFDKAINAANYKLVNEDEFILFLDVKRARFSGIKPLPQRVKTFNGWEIIPEKEVFKRENQEPDQIIIHQGIDEAIESKFSKQKLWERKLLDLSLRNNLLNLRISQNTIQLFSINLSSFEDALADGSEFQVLARPDEWFSNSKEDGILHHISMSDPVVDLIKFDISHKRLRTFLTESDLKSSLTKLYRSSRLSLEENGANTLYLALGFLKWFETPSSQLARYAPLLLLPVEIIRKSAQIGYVIRSREEETFMNITLLEMLKQDFEITIDGLEELPRDSSGVDVIKVFNIIRRGIMSKPRWDVEEHAILGIFSFSKFIMWNDIHNNASKLAENKIVKSLISGKLEWLPDLAIEDVDYDKKYHPSEIALPISADSTQLEAICSATENKSFILHGPPGTGKSQTITNIIANALYQGKKVLFVAEKMAALTVVQKRLADIGLDPFCLELHSNKSKKSAVLEQLRKTTEIIRKSSPLEYKTEADRLHFQRSELNDYVEALHKRHHFGFSLYEAFTGYAQLVDANDAIQFDQDIINELTTEKYVSYIDIVEELQNAGTLCGHPHNHPLNLITTTIYNQQNRIEAQELITKYINVLEKKSENQKVISQLLKLDLVNLDKSQSENLIKLCEVVMTLPDSTESLIGGDFPERVLNQVMEICQHGLKRDKYRADLCVDFSDKILGFDAEVNLSRWNLVSQKWFLPRLIGQNKIINTIQPFSKNGKIEKDKVSSLLEKIIMFQSEKEIIDKNTNFLVKELGHLWQNGDCDWNTILAICKASLQINDLLFKTTEDPFKVNEIRRTIATQLNGGVQLFIKGKGKVLNEYLTVDGERKQIEVRLSELLGIDFNTVIYVEADWTAYWNHLAEHWLSNLDNLRNWASWNLCKEKTIEAGLISVVNSYDGGNLSNEEVLTSFKKSLFRHFSEFIISKDPSLSVFNGKLFEGKIKKFKEQSIYFQELTKAELYAKLASKIPSFSQEAATSSEIGILQRAIRNNGRAMSIRRLFDQIPNLLPRMCPCMLMSPISVAQYFEVDKSKFDLIVFDEASQMPTCEAVGAIARGQNVIVVGDPKQMPPTSFFSTNHFDEDNADKEDLESILDDCLALSIPSKHLLWHYRSKHESLIAFSNSNYYENKLLTFPSPDDIASKVTNVFVPGYYDRGKTRQNSFEAKAIVGEVLNRLADPILSKRSLGIVTFSSVQQNLIEDLLNEAFKQNPDLEKIAVESSEPIFVKNLENVQGDERDVILFSVGYGPDQDGKIYLNFGPLNREGGWRRLNVAISRARYEMKVFSTLRSEQIDISRTSSEGVAGIKSFLEYTEKGKLVLLQSENIKKSSKRYLEMKIAEEIRKLGYLVKTDIGYSGYRIDIGIVNPNNTSEYILGILTDGINYKAAKTAKDREIVQADVLKMLGWNIYKLWTPDWWYSPKKVIDDIVQLIEQIKTSKNERNNTDIETCSTPGNKVFLDVKLAGITQDVVEIPSSLAVYETCILEKSSLVFSDEFFYSGVRPKILDQINQVLEIEAPISHNLLSKRILTAWGFARLGVKLNEYLIRLYNQLDIQKTTQNGKVFYWKRDQDPEKYNKFRVAKEDEQKRDVEDIPKEELVCGIRDVLINQISLPEDDLVREVSKKFGYARLGGNVDQTMKMGIEYALTQRVLIRKDGKIILS